MKRRKKNTNCISGENGKTKMQTSDSGVLRKSILLKRLLIISFVLALGFTGGAYVYAKYYSAKAREGIAVATGVYFTANYAVSTEEDGEFVESLVSSSYQGTDTSFTFEIRNYENNLLFNTSNVDVPYEIKFWLGEEIADGTVYSVSSIDGSATSAISTSGITFADQSIAGGSAKSNKYAITVDVPDGNTHTPVPIYVQVNTLEGSLINRVLKGKMFLSSVNMSESYIESQQFIVPDETTSMTDAEKFEKLQSLAGFTYEIRTVGEVTSSGELTEELKLSWNPNILQIDIFDEAYMEWLENAQKEDPSVTEPVVDAGTGWYSITIKAMPYSAENISFFRGKDFDTGAEAGTLNWESLHQAIKAEKYVES